MDTELNGYNKLTDGETNRKAMMVLNRLRVDCYAAIIISPSWDYSDFKNAGNIMKKMGIKFVNLQPLTPLKGTGLDFPDDKLIISRKDYEKWDLAHVSIRPEKMSIREFYENILDLYERIILNPGNLIGFIWYPLVMQLRMINGIRKVRKQYKDMIMEATEDA